MILYMGKDLILSIFLLCQRNRKLSPIKRQKHSHEITFINYYEFQICVRLKRTSLLIKGIFVEHAHTYTINIYNELVRGDFEDGLLLDGKERISIAKTLWWNALE